MKGFPEELDRLLETDTEELERIAHDDGGEPGADPRVGRAARTAQVILREQELLAQALRSLATVSAEAPGPQRWRRSWAVGGLALAAGLAAILLVNTEPDVERQAAPVPPSALERIAGSAPLVRSQEGKNIAVLATDNPNISVIWFY